MNSKLDRITDWPQRAQKANYCATTLAKNCGVSLRVLQRFFREKMKMSPKKWLLAQRREKAGAALRQNKSVKETAALLDYKHPNHLTNEFTKHLGCCPTRLKVALLPLNP